MSFQAYPLQMFFPLCWILPEESCKDFSVHREITFILICLYSIFWFACNLPVFQKNVEKFQGFSFSRLSYIKCRVCLNALKVWELTASCLINSLRLLCRIEQRYFFYFKMRHPIMLLTIRLLMSYIYGAPILDVSRSHSTTHHSR